MAAVAQRAKGAAAFQGIGRTPWGRPLWRDLVRVGGRPGGPSGGQMGVALPAGTRRALNLETLKRSAIVLVL